MREPRAETLHLAGILGVARRQRHAARHDHAGQILRAGQRQHRRRQSLVAGRDAEHAGRRRQRSDQPPHHDRRVVAIGQAVEHAGRALRPAVAGVAAVDGERNRAGRAQRFRGAAHQQSDLPVAGVIAERDRLALLRAQAAHRADDDVLRSAEGVRAPAHAGVLGQAEDVAARLVAQHLRASAADVRRALRPRCASGRSAPPNRAPARAAAEIWRRHRAAYVITVVYARVRLDGIWSRVLPDGRYDGGVILRSTHLAALVACALTACSSPPEPGPAATTARETTTATIAAAPFGRQDDTPVQLYTLTNKNGLVARITNYGAIVTELHVPDRTARSPTSCSASRISTAISPGTRTSARSSDASPIASETPSSRWRQRATRWRRTTNHTTCTAARRAGTRWSGRRRPPTRRTVRRSS